MSPALLGVCAVNVKEPLAPGARFRTEGLTCPKETSFCVARSEADLARVPCSLPPVMSKMTAVQRPAAGWSTSAGVKLLVPCGSD